MDLFFGDLGALGALGPTSVMGLKSRLYFVSVELCFVPVFGVIERNDDSGGEPLAFSRGGNSFVKLEVKSQKRFPEGVDGCDLEKRLWPARVGDEGGESGESNGEVIERVDEEEFLELA